MAGNVEGFPVGQGGVAPLQDQGCVEFDGFVGDFPHQLLQVGGQAVPNILVDAQAGGHGRAHIHPSYVLVEIVVFVGVGNIPRQELGFDDAGLQRLVAFPYRHGDGRRARRFQDPRVVGADGRDFDAVKIRKGHDGVFGGQVVGVDDHRHEENQVVAFDFLFKRRNLVERSDGGFQNDAGVAGAERNGVGPVAQGQFAGIIGVDHRSGVGQPDFHRLQGFARFGQGAGPVKVGPFDPPAAAPLYFVGPPLLHLAHQEGRRRQGGTELQLEHFLVAGRGGHCGGRGGRFGGLRHRRGRFGSRGHCGGRLGGCGHRGGRRGAGGRGAGAAGHGGRADQP